MKKTKVLIGCLTLVGILGLNGLMTSCKKEDGPVVPTPPDPVKDTYKIALITRILSRWRTNS